MGRVRRGPAGQSSTLHVGMVLIISGRGEGNRYTQFPQYEDIVWAEPVSDR
ncbi:hypothetical protein ACFV1C_11815 [Streptomyces sp. NPDC059605]|uniref:hypothetical protein n=1 Tax=unclassified Streptomyces TaxID=2593676 RepID=UPI0036A34613